MEEENKKNKKKVATKKVNLPSGVMSFSAISKTYEDNLPSGIEKVGRKGFVDWGKDNKFPFFLYELWKNVPTLASIIGGCQDYIAGDAVLLNGKEDVVVNDRGETIRDIVRELALEKSLYGGYALEVIRTKSLKEIAGVYVLPLRFLRTDLDREKFEYNEGFGDRWNKKESIILKKFLMDEPLDASVLYVKGAGLETYPISRYQSAILPCAIEMEVNRYHYNSLKSGFMGSHLVSFNSGRPTDEEKAEMESDFYEKFCGTENAGSVLLVWTAGKDFAPEIAKMDVDDFGVKYESLVKRARQEIYSAFRANPNLFGIPTENKGFSKEEYDQTFELFNRTTIKPMQKDIISALNRIYGEGSVEIVPFSSLNSVTNG